MEDLTSVCCHRHTTSGNTLSREAAERNDPERHSVRVSQALPLKPWNASDLPRMCPSGRRAEASPFTRNTNNRSFHLLTLATRGLFCLLSSSSCSSARTTALRITSCITAYSAARRFAVVDQRRVFLQRLTALGTRRSSDPIRYLQPV